MKKAIAASFLLAGGIVGNRRHTLYQMDHDKYTPELSTRAGAYYGTKGYKEGTIGNVAHHAIGTLIVIFGSFGEDDVGTLFNSQRMKNLYPKPINSPESEEFNLLEYKYWKTKHDAGGVMASMFPPFVRKLIEYGVFFKEYSWVIRVEKWIFDKFGK